MANEKSRLVDSISREVVAGLKQGRLGGTTGDPILTVEQVLRAIGSARTSIDRVLSEIAGPSGRRTSLTIRNADRHLIAAYRDVAKAKRELRAILKQ